MSEETLLSPLAQTVLDHLLRQHIERILKKAKEIAKELNKLSSAQKNGLAELALHAPDLKTIQGELAKREKQRWAADDRSGLLKQMGTDIDSLQSIAANLTKDVHALLVNMPDENKLDENQIHLELVRRYLAAAADFARSN